MVKNMSEWKFTSKEFSQIPEKFSSGHRACAGCGPAIVLRLVMKAAKGPIIATNATGCMEVVSTIYPYTSWNIPWIHTAFETAAANIPSILIPYPYAIEDHQFYNAKYISDRGKAVLLRENELSAKSLSGIIKSLLENDKEKYLKMKESVIPDSGIKSLEIITEKLMEERIGSQR